MTARKITVEDAQYAVEAMTCKSNYAELGKLALVYITQSQREIEELRQRLASENLHSSCSSEIDRLTGERDEALARLAAREFIGYEYDCQDGHTETVVVEWDKAGCELADMRYRAELAEFKLKQLECTLSSDAAIERAEKAEAACAEMRAAWVKLIKSYQTNDWKEASDCLNAILADSEQIQRSDAGKGWHGPEEWAKQQADYEDVCNRLNDLEQEHEIAGEKGEVQLGQLRAENERLREALGWCADHLELLRAVGVDYISGRARSYGEQILQTLITGYVPVPDESLDDRAQRIRGAEARARDLFEKLCRLAVEVPT